MAEQFYTILTAVGKAKIANAAALGNKVELTHLALGDGGGNYYNPTEDQTALRNEVWRGNIGNVSVDEENPNWIIVQTIIPGQTGGFMIREAGIFDAEGELIAIGKYPETYKPTSEAGSIKDLVVRMILEVSNTSSVALKVDPTVILATQKQVEEAENRTKAYTDQKVGIVDQTLAAHKAENASKHITESGINENGRYIKFDDGTCICYRKVHFTLSDLDTGLNFLEYDLPIVITSYSAAITNVTVITGEMNVLNTLTVRNDGWIKNGKWGRIVLEKKETMFTNEIHLSLFAIGRWK